MLITLCCTESIEKSTVHRISLRDNNPHGRLKSYAKAIELSSFYPQEVAELFTNGYQVNSIIQSTYTLPGAKGNLTHCREKEVREQTIQHN